MPHPNEVLIREFFEDFSRGEFAAAAARFSDDVVLHVPGRNPFAGTIRGRAAWLTSLRTYGEAQAAGVRLGFEIHDVVGGDGHAIALLSVQAEHGEERIEWRRAAVYHVRNGSILEVWIHDVDQYGIDEFFSRMRFGG